MNKLLSDLIETLKSADSTVNKKEGDMMSIYQIHNLSHQEITFLNITKIGNSITIEGIHKNISVDFPTKADKTKMSQDDLKGLNEIYQLTLEKS